MLKIPLIMVFLAGVTISNTSAKHVSITHSARNGKIIGGVKTQIEKHPWHVRLGRPHANGLEVLCGGSLIARTWVLTAAHCLVDPNGRSRGITTVLAGSNLTSFLNYLRRTIDYQIIHEDYSSSNSSRVRPNDIALVHISEPFEYDKTVRAEDLFGFGTEDLVGQNVTVSGYGSMGNEHPVRIREVELEIIDQVACDRFVSNKYRTNVTHHGQICGISGDGTPKGTCKGDSGGPAVYNRYIVGVVSWSTRPCGSGVTVFTEVSYYRNWIFGSINSYRNSILIG